MKKVGLLNLFALMIMALIGMPLSRAASIDIPDFEISPGGLATVSVNLTPDADEAMFPYKGVQFDITLPGDITLNTTDYAPAALLNSFSLEYAAQADGSIRFLTYTEGNSVTETENILSLTFECAPTAQEGQETISISNVIFSSPVGIDIDGTDSQTIVTIIVEPEPEIEAYIYIPDFSIERGTTYKAPVSVEYEMEAMFDYAGYQFDLTLPAHITIASATYSEALGGGNVRYEQQPNGAVRFFSTRGGNASDLMDITFEADNEAIAGDFPLLVTNVAFSTDKGLDIFLEDSESTITITVTEIPVDEIVLNAEDITIMVTETYQLTATVLPENATVDTTVTWTSADPTIATVSQNGLVTGIAPGEVEVTASCGDVSATCMVTVIPYEEPTVMITSLKLDPTTMTLWVDDEPATIMAIIEPENASNKTLNWSSSDPAVATVDAYGVVTPVSPGKTIVTAATIDGSNLTATCEVTVLMREISVDEIVLNAEDITIMVTETYQLTATVLPENATVDTTVTWTSADPEIATVSETGLVTGVAPGVVEVTASCSDVSATCMVTVIPYEEPTVMITSLKLDPTTMTLWVDDEPATIMAIIEPENASIKTLNWSSSDPVVATVDAYGVVTPVSPGKTTVTAATIDGSNLTATCEVTVLMREIPVDEIVLNAEDITIMVTETYQLTATILPENATVDTTVTWTSADPEIATVSETGLVTGIAPGVVEVTASCGDVSATCMVTVIPKTEPEVMITKLELSPESMTLWDDDEPAQITAIITPENASNKVLNWSSSNPAVATVDDNGLVTPIAVGRTTVTAATTDGSNLTATCEVTVIERTVPGPEIPENPTVPAMPIPDGWYGNDNGTYVSALKIREGNSLGMGVNNPEGGYPEAFDFMWTAPDKAFIGEGREIWTTAELYGQAANAGKGQAISENIYNVTITNYDDMGGEFWQATLPTATVQVYKRPQIPTQLLRKGDGTSFTFVVMMTPLGNQEILDLGYWYVYGYNDAQGMPHVLDTTQRRYTHTTGDIYNNASYTFWAYSFWNYADGSVVTSGLRYLDGSEDPDFDASTYDGATRAVAPEAPKGIFSLDGRYLGEDASQLEPGIYVVNGQKVLVK